MYTHFYGLREKPFSLSPDPRYLFLADSHREAMAHLLYGIEQGEGFIAVTGEVGTGKTTICRTLLHRLEPGTEVAFIFNPQLSPDELLLSIAAEFGLPSDGRTRREILDDLNRFLLAKKVEGRRVLLILDEAQNLPPETLEQIRMLSNLETDTQKLVQIVLIGQPELDDMLESPRLRQLRQRISVRWRLRPLSAQETRDYVRHRLRIAAGAPREVFSELALREIHRRSRGVPRVVNLLCDRALLAGYAAGARTIGLGLVTQTEREIRGAGAPTRAPRLERAAPWLRRIGFAAAAAAALALGFVSGPSLIARVLPASTLAPVASAPPAAPVLPPPTEAFAAPEAGGRASGAGDAHAAWRDAPAPEAPERPAPAVAEVLDPFAPDLAPESRVVEGGDVPEEAAAALPESGIEPAGAAAASPPVVASAPPVPPPARLPEPPAGDVGEALARTAPGVALARATRAALARWGLESSAGDVLAPDEALALLAQRGLETLPLRGATPAALAWFDRPALVELRASDGTPRMLLLVALDREHAHVEGLGGAATPLPVDVFAERLTGQARVVWRDFEGLPALLSGGERGAPVAWLQHALGRLGFYDRPATGDFDAVTQEAVRAFQRSRRLQPDGTVGPLTKMALYEALGRYGGPDLSGAASARRGAAEREERG